MSLSPRGYACFISVIVAKLLVTLQRPPPVISTFASTFCARSKIVTLLAGSVFCAVIAAMNPAAPPPMIAIFIPLKLQI